MSKESDRLWPRLLWTLIWFVLPAILFSLLVATLDTLCIPRPPPQRPLLERFHRAFPEAQLPPQPQGGEGGEDLQPGDPPKEPATPDQPGD